MEKKEVIKIIDELTKKNSEYRAEVNDKLNHIRGSVKQAYNQGAEDVWELVRKIVGFPADGGYSAEYLNDVFDTCMLSTIVQRYDVKEAMGRVKGYEECKKKEEENQKLKCGDVVKIIDKLDRSLNGRGAIYLGEDLGHYSVILRGTYNSTYLSKRVFALTKTGEHIDIHWLNRDEDEEEEE